LSFITSIINLISFYKTRMSMVDRHNREKQQKDV